MRSSRCSLRTQEARREHSASRVQVCGQRGESDVSATGVKPLFVLTLSSAPPRAVEVAHLLGVERVRTPWLLVPRRSFLGQRAARGEQADLRVSADDYEPVSAGKHRDCILCRMHINR